MNFFKLMALSLLTLNICSLLLARRPLEERAFIKAVKDNNTEIIDRLFTSVRRQRTYDKALKTAGRKGNIALYKKIEGYASPRGRRKAANSLKRRGYAVIVNQPMVLMP